MLFTKLFLAAAAVLPVLARNSIPGVGCGAPVMDGEILDNYKSTIAEAAQMRLLGNITAERGGMPRIKVYFHIVAAGKTKKQGWVTRKQIEKQMYRLNADFARSAITFELGGIDYIVNKKWTQDKDMTAMRKKLRKGGYKDLNLYYITKFAGGNLGGYCTYPQSNVKKGSNVWWQDGCTINAFYIAGGNVAQYGPGRITVHEVGHWLGLQHTFEGGCKGNGDGIADTPAEAEAAFHCPKGRNTCPNSPGVDPIHNHMDYTYDTCKSKENGFSVIQGMTMRLNWYKMRMNKA